MCYHKKVKSLSHFQLFVTPWTVAYQPPLSMGFPKQEYCSGLPFPSSGDLPDLGIEPWSLELQADALHLSHKKQLFIKECKVKSVPKFKLAENTIQISIQFYFCD